MSNTLLYNIFSDTLSSLHFYHCLSHKNTFYYGVQAAASSLNLPITFLFVESKNLLSFG